MEAVGRWWNGQWGRLGRRDVWLRTDGTVWRVEARRGDGDARVWSRDYDTEEAARAMLDELLTRGAKEWQDLSDV